MKISELKQSKYLTKDDCTPPITVTITKVTKENLAKDNEPPEMKYVLNFQECKPMVLNVTNGNLIAHVTGSEETDDWVGKRITLWNDPTVSFAGQMTGGVRVQVQATAQTGEAAPAQPASETDYPF